MTTLKMRRAAKRAARLAKRQAETEAERTVRKLRAHLLRHVRQTATGRCEQCALAQQTYKEAA